jgi:predicted ATPase
LIGRDPELATVCAALWRAAAGGPGVVLVRGEADIGKTRLITTVLAEDAHETQVLGHCAPAISGETPFAPLIDGIRDVLRGLLPDQAEALVNPGAVVLAAAFPSSAGRRFRSLVGGSEPGW